MCTFKYVYTEFIYTHTHTQLWSGQSSVTGLWTYFDAPGEKYCLYLPPSPHESQKEDENVQPSGFIDFCLDLCSMLEGMWL